MAGTKKEPMFSSWFNFFPSFAQHQKTKQELNDSRAELVKCHGDGGERQQQQQQLDLGKELAVRKIYVKNACRRNGL